MPLSGHGVGFPTGDTEATFNNRPQQAYDQRLQDLVRATGNPNVVAQLGVPRSTAWVGCEASTGA